MLLHLHPSARRHSNAARTSAARRSAPLKGGKGTSSAPSVEKPRAKGEPQTVRPAAAGASALDAPLSASAIAAHGELYDYISFSNIPQWVAMCTIPFNAYRLASQRDDRAAQEQAVQDILLLPQQVLTRTGRGPGEGRRLHQTVRARCRTFSEQLRKRYDCQLPRDHNVQLDLAAHTAPPPPPSTAPPAAAATAPAPSSEGEPAAAAGDPECGDEDGDDYARAFQQSTAPDVSDPDIRAARKAQHLVRHGFLQRAARVLHSTTAVADLQQAQVQAAVAALHPTLPPTSVIPPLPDNAPEQILEDDDVMTALLRQSDNGAASGPSGWGVNLLSSLAQSELCRMGIIALLKDIVNGHLPERARQLLLASRLVALTKASDGKYRPIAVGELFYRLAGVLVVRKVTADAASLLAPHQLGVGVRSGAEQIVHSLQHSLTDTTTKRALLKVDISNAFNSCDRARVLRQLYEQPTLSAMWRIADFGYAVPSQLLLQRCEGQHLLSSNGVRQGDALSAILFCLYLRDVLAKVGVRAQVKVDGFFDDLNVSGEPAEVMKAFTQLQQLLPEVGLDFNTSKSSFAYFHDADAPLMRSIRTTLAEHNIEVRTDWVTVVGAVIGRDADAISAGVAATQAVDQSSAAFFRRLQLEPLNVQSAMIVLRQCGVPQMNYSLRCMPPSCIAQQAAAFDDLVIGAAQSKLLLHADEMCKAETLERLRAPLRHGGFGLTSALSTSPAAFLGSMAAVAASGAPVFLPHSQPDCPLPSTSLLYGWLEDSMQKVRVHQLAPQLPATAASFFQHFPPRLPSSRDLSAFVLQRELSSQATSNTYKASLQRTKELGKTDGGRALAHLVAVSAPRAWAWKSVAPTSKELELTDTQYRLAARLNLDLQPMEGAAALSDDCSLCGGSNAIRNDPWHYLSCVKLRRREITVRHDDVGRTLHRNALTLGLKAQLEPKGLQADSNLRPDLLISLPGRTILTDVVVCHPLAPGAVKQQRSKLANARTAEHRKKRKYAKLASQRRYEMLPFAVETSGGFAPAAVQLMHAMALAAAQTFQLWTHTAIIQQLVGSVAIAVQRGTAMSYLDGYERGVGASGAKASTCTVEVIDDDDEDDAAAGSGRELVRKRK